MRPNKTDENTIFSITPGYKMNLAHPTVTSANRLFQCCQNCLNDIDCHSFNYVPSSGECELTPFVFTDSDLVNTADGLTITPDSHTTLGTATRNMKTGGFSMFL